MNIREVFGEDAKAPLANVWPAASEGSHVSRMNGSDGLPKVTVTPPPPGSAPARVPLATIEELHDLLLVRIRNGPNKDGDYMMLRARDRVRRLPPDPLTPEALFRYLEMLEKCGGHHKAAQAAGLPYRAVALFAKDCPDFKLLVDEALERYRENIELEIHRRGVEGWDVPVFGGREKDRVVGSIRQFDGKLLELHAKRHIPEYREKFEGELKITAGVLVVPAVQKTPQDWAAQHGGAPGTLPPVQGEAKELPGPPPENP